MTDEELIAEDDRRPHELPHAYDADSHVHGRPCTLCGKGPDNPVHRLGGRAAAQATEGNHG